MGLLNKRFTTLAAVVVIKHCRFFSDDIFTPAEGLHCSNRQLKSLSDFLISEAEATHFSYRLFLVIGHILCLRSEGRTLHLVQDRQKRKPYQKEKARRRKNPRRAVTVGQLLDLWFMDLSAKAVYPLFTVLDKCIGEARRLDLFEHGVGVCLD